MVELKELAKRLAECATPQDLSNLKFEYVKNSQFSRETFNKAAKLLTKEQREKLKAFTAVLNIYDAKNKQYGSVDWSDIICAIDFMLKFLGWSIEDGKSYISDKYGKRSRHQLTDLELWEFYEYLSSLSKTCL